MALTVSCCILALLYVLLMAAYRLGWHLQRLFVLPPALKPHTSLSVIIPARNESRNIGACLDSILANDYPRDLLEIIVVDDHSEDDTAAIVARYSQYPVKLLRLQDLPTLQNSTAHKKNALSQGIANSRGSLIITTDADCMAPPGWLQYISALHEQAGAQLIIAPVDFTEEPGVLNRFQSLDFMTMQGITAAAQQLGMGNMANGANLAFTRKAYDAVHGYEGYDHFASGDDYMLLVKIKARFPDGVRYLKAPEAIVRTAAQPDWPSFLQQRVRWASKNGKYKDHRLTAVLSLVYLFNLSLLALMIAVCIWQEYFLLFGGLLVIKTVVELLFLVPVARFFSKQQQLPFFPLLQPLHIAYICAAGMLGWKGDFNWKGRQVK